FAILSTAVSSFFTGTGRTRTVMWANVGATVVNIVLDYGLIFGNLGIPEMGIRGAAIATVASSVFGVLALLWFFLDKDSRRDYQTSEAWRPDFEIFKRLMRYGVPSGINFMLDLFAFTFFILLVGRLGERELAATTLAFQVNTLAFFPMIGFSIATATLVGQRLGENKPYLAARSVWAAFHLTLVYMFSMACLYILVPGVLLTPFGARANPTQFSEIREMAVIILRFVALYSVFDAMNLIFASALKGAGDTLFVMFLSTTLGMTLMVMPAWIVCKPGGAGIYAAWTFLTLFVIVLGFSFLLRFLHGKWQYMRVINTALVEPDLDAAV
ncbi:MAG: MATE family efflux transporter, partial [Armatimonadota bacterium]